MKILQTVQEMAETKQARLTQADKLTAYRFLLILNRVYQKNPQPNCCVKYEHKKLKRYGKKGQKQVSKLHRLELLFELVNNQINLTTIGVLVQKQPQGGSKLDTISFQAVCTGFCHCGYKGDRTGDVQSAHFVLKKERSQIHGR